VAQHVELASATTAYGSQGTTVPTCHVSVGDHTGASSAYVGMTRGHHHNTAHLVAPTLAEARDQWIEVFSRDRADLGPTHAARLAAEEVDRYGPNAPHDSRRRRRMLSPAEVERRELERRRQSAPTLDYSPPSRTRSPGIGF
jgi:exodeoxyribonuclease V alpha subunit